MNPIIKFTTLFGLLAVELAVTIDGSIKYWLAAAFFLIALCFVYRSFYGMRIRSGSPTEVAPMPTAKRSNAEPAGVN
jgi:K(+)-stimulated pyrophosphate-energized sodium pump